jgi:hypothetical protein
MKKAEDQQAQPAIEKTADLLKEKPTLWVESHIKIFDPKSGEQIVNTRA